MGASASEIIPVGARVVHGHGGYVHISLNLTLTSSVHNPASVPSLRSPWVAFFSRYACRHAFSRRDYSPVAQVIILGDSGYVHRPFVPAMVSELFGGVVLCLVESARPPS